MTQHYTDTELMTWRPAKNVGSVAINAREVCKVVTGGDSLKRSIVAVQQPDSSAGQNYCVNGPMTIPPGGFGRVCFDPVVLVAYDSGTPAIDEAWGWKAGQGTVSKNSNPLVTVMRIVDPDAKVVMGRWAKTELVAFELKDDVDPSASGPFAAWSLSWNTSTNDYGDPDYGSDPDLQLYDPFSKFLAVGHDHIGSGSGFHGFCNAEGVIVRLDSAQIGKLSGSLSQGSTASVTIWVDSGGTDVATSMTVTARDWLMTSGATSIASGKKVILQVISGVIRVTEAECP